MSDIVIGKVYRISWCGHDGLAKIVGQSHDGTHYTYFGDVTRLVRGQYCSGQRWCLKSYNILRPATPAEEKEFLLVSMR